VTAWVALTSHRRVTAGDTVLTQDSGGVSIKPLYAGRHISLIGSSRSLSGTMSHPLLLSGGGNTLCSISVGIEPENSRKIFPERGRPLVEALQPWLREKLSLISQKTKFAEAIRYALSRWAGLCLFLEDGRVEIDNNAVERAIRPLASIARTHCSPVRMAAPSIGR
jgi:hypothetical protein